ncbi:F-box protein CPR1 [Medicago truncatula]|uniref:F-box protein CPR1 n=1 Tax=Medicago truncatula TaxID=3880 RepID=UPI000D2F2CBA|nr:F-box protein CPR1 [Medicago truncatula]
MKKRNRAVVEKEPRNEIESEERNATIEPEAIMAAWCNGITIILYQVLSSSRYSSIISLFYCVRDNIFFMRACSLSTSFFKMLGYGYPKVLSINGIVCVHANSNCGAIVFWNPATQAIKLIPPSPLELVELPIPGVAKEFVNVEAFTYLHGFGYDSVIDDYKVICLVSFDIQVELGDTFSDSLLEDIYLDELWEIYSLRSNSWRKLDIDMPSSSYCIEGTQVYMDGVCHWLCEENTPAGPCLVSFYLRNEVFCITPIPSDEDDCFKFKASKINLVLLNGSISLTAFHRETTTFHIAILGELGIKESWIKLFTVGPLSCVERPIGVGTKGEIFFQRKDNELAWFDLSTQVIEELGYKARGPYTRISLYKENILVIEGISN